MQTIKGFPDSINFRAERLEKSFFKNLRRLESFAQWNKKLIAYNANTLCEQLEWPPPPCHAEIITRNSLDLMECYHHKNRELLPVLKYLHKYIN